VSTTVKTVKAFGNDRTEHKTFFTIFKPGLMTKKQNKQLSAEDCFIPCVAASEIKHMASPVMFLLSTLNNHYFK